MHAIRTGKWEKYKIMKRDKKLQPYLPETTLMNPSSFWRAICKYKIIILKPCSGSNGNGVIKVSKIKTGFEIRHGRRKTLIQGENKTFLYLEKKIKNRKYIAQRYIDLSKIKGRPFDIRVMVLRGKNKPWKVYGRFAKVAIKGYVVTNTAEEILTTKIALIKSPLKNERKLLNEIDRIALLTARQLGQYYPNQSLFGLDIGLDRQGAIWIIEANTKPSITPFLLLGDSKMYRKLLSLR